MTEGRKDDNEKTRLDLIPAEVMESLGQVLTHGSKKYGDNNWMSGIKYRRVYAAMQRHLQAWRMGKYVDDDSGLPHLWLAFTELAFLIYFEQNKYAEFNDFIPEWMSKVEDSL